MVITLMAAIKTVPEGMAYTVERYGRYLKTLNPGLHVITPYMDKIGYRVTMRERKVQVQFPDLKTKDNQEVIGSADVYVNVIDAHKAAYENGDVDENVRHKSALAMIKMVKSMTLDDVMTRADSLDQMLLESIKSYEDAWGLQIKYIDIHKVYPSA